MPKNRLDEISDFYDYFEVQPLGNNEYLLRNETVHSMEELADVNRRIVELGREKEGKLVVALETSTWMDCDAHFREILQAGQGYKDSMAARRFAIARPRKCWTNLPM